MFRQYAREKGESVWAPFLTLLNRPDDISVNLTAWILARLACDGDSQMEGSDLQLYITWLKDQMRKQVRWPTSPGLEAQTVQCSARVISVHF